MEAFKKALAKIANVAKTLWGILPKRIVLAVIGAALAGIARKWPDLPLLTPEEILIGIGTLIGADTVRKLGSDTATAGGAPKVNP